MTRDSLKLLWTPPHVKMKLPRHKMVRQATENEINAHANNVPNELSESQSF